MTGVHSNLFGLLRTNNLAPLRLGGRTLLPIVQGGMGVGVSAHRLAGSVAALGAMGTISSVDLRRLHPDLMERTRGLAPGAAATQAAKVAINESNLEALEREIRAAKALSEGRGLLAINVMRAVSEYGPSVTRALECGIDAVVVGAGLPLDLPDLAQDHSAALLIPILSDARGVQLLVRKWERKKRVPDAIVIEHPRLAGGHLGAAKVADLNDPRFEFENVTKAKAGQPSWTQQPPPMPRLGAKFGSLAPPVRYPDDRSELKGRTRSLRTGDALGALGGCRRGITLGTPPKLVNPPSEGQLCVEHSATDVRCVPTSARIMTVSLEAETHTTSWDINLVGAPRAQGGRRRDDERSA